MKELRERYKVARHMHGWRNAVASLSGSAGVPARSFLSLLIVPSDVSLIIGSRGDDAMISTIVAEARGRNPQCKIGIVSVRDELPAVLAELGIVNERIWRGSECAPIVETMSRYDALAVVGADVMDGHFSSADALRSWIFADIAARLGRRAVVLGFSFSAKPAAALRPVLTSLSSNLRLFARDRVSKEHFSAMSRAPIDIAPDIAFLLPPSPTSPQFGEVKMWIAEQRLQGRLVCAFNTHPMIFDDCDLAKIEKLNQHLVVVMKSMMERFSLSLLLVPHDFRDVARRDNTSLTPLYEALLPTFDGHAFFADAECRAAELKALVGMADLLITGRMHLGVGALSMGVPIWAINPQDKFIGLFEHFGLPDQRLEPEVALNQDRLETFLAEAFSSWREVKARVLDRLPKVIEEAQRNFSPFD